MLGNDNAPLGTGGVNQTLAAGGTLAPPSLPTATADIATGEAWWAAATKALDELAASGEPFTSSDLFALLGRPERGRQMGSFMAAARRHHKIVHVGVAVGKHGQLVRVWRGAR
jgi:hypothetical protein